MSDFVERCDFTLNLLLLIYSPFSSVSLSQSDVPNSLIIQLSHHIGSFFNHQPFLFGIAFHSSVMSLLSFGFMQRKRENCNEKMQKLTCLTFLKKRNTGINEVSVKFCNIFLDISWLRRLLPRSTSVRARSPVFSWNVFKNLTKHNKN